MGIKRPYNAKPDNAKIGVGFCQIPPELQLIIVIMLQDPNIIETCCLICTVNNRSCDCMIAFVSRGLNYVMQSIAQPTQHDLSPSLTSPMLICDLVADCELFLLATDFTKPSIRAFRDFICHYVPQNGYMKKAFPVLLAGLVSKHEIFANRLCIYVVYKTLHEELDKCDTNTIDWDYFDTLMSLLICNFVIDPETGDSDDETLQTGNQYVQLVFRVLMRVLKTHPLNEEWNWTKHYLPKLFEHAPHVECFHQLGGYTAMMHTMLICNDDFTWELLSICFFKSSVHSSGEISVLKHHEFLTELMALLDTMKKNIYCPTSCESYSSYRRGYSSMMLSLTRLLLVFSNEGHDCVIYPTRLVKQLINFVQPLAQKEKVADGVSGSVPSTPAPALSATSSQPESNNPDLLDFKQMSLYKANLQQSDAGWLLHTAEEYSDGVTPYGVFGDFADEDIDDEDIDNDRFIWLVRHAWTSAVFCLLSQFHTEHLCKHFHKLSERLASWTRDVRKVPQFARMLQNKLQ